MSWPLSQDYNEAIQSPASNFADPDLRRGEAATNKLGLPMPYSGNFADVYQVRCPDGGRWAVKCFTREAVGLRERYQEISRHLGRMKLPFTVDFTYLEQGIRVAGKWYPVLKMEWVEGLTLNQFVGRYADNPTLLEALSRNWGRTAKYLRAAQVGHCDLQHGNVLLTPGANAGLLALKLIDYDGMWAPALAGKKSGEVGHASYQHPRRLREGTYGIDVDRFPVLLIATALRALQVKGRALWDKYDNGDNLLFKEADFLAPLQSHLFLDLTKTGDGLVSRMTDILVKALRGSLETVPLLEQVMPEALGSSSASYPPLRESGPSVRQVSPPQAPLAAPAAPVVAPPDADGTFDFGEPPAAAPGISSSRPKRTRATRKPRVPVWAWTAAVTLLIVALAVTAVTFFAIQNGGSNPYKDAQPPKNGLKTNSIGMKLALIHAGHFSMGSPANEQGRNADEGPQHEVEITRPFYMGVYPVTQAEYKKVIGANPSFFCEQGKEENAVRGLNTDRFPVENVSWDDVKAFCKALNRLDAARPAGMEYALPTEAEWEYACRAGRETAFSFDGDIGALGKYAWYTDNSGGRVHEVGGKKPNLWGLCDMHGNVWQWCADHYGVYTDGSVKDPNAVTDSTYRVMRGGSWREAALDCRSAVRDGHDPGYRDGRVGFRVVLRVPARNP